MKVVLYPLLVLDTYKKWYAVKPIHPILPMFYTYVSAMDWLMGGDKCHQDFLQRIREKTQTSNDEDIECIQEFEEEAFFRYCTDEDRNLEFRWSFE